MTAKHAMHISKRYHQRKRTVPRPALLYGWATHLRRVGIHSRHAGGPCGRQLEVGLPLGQVCQVVGLIDDHIHLQDEDQEG
jgi:hypothetical protein